MDIKIVTVRGLCVLMDSELAALYQVSTKALLQAVRRNPQRFPDDFIIVLTKQDVADLRSQSVTSSQSPAHGGRRYSVMAFTEQGVAMLSSVLRSERAVQVNIEIMRAFVQLRRAASINQEIMTLISDLSSRVASHDAVIQDLVEAIQQLIKPPDSPAPGIGFLAPIK